LLLGYFCPPHPKRIVKKDKYKIIVPAHDVMKMVADYFEPGTVNVKRRKNGRHGWFLEIIRN
jgi:hypothetical protein